MLYPGPRHPPPTKGPVQNMKDYECSNGFSCVVMKDLQRVYACLYLRKLGDGPLEPEMVAYLSSVAGAASHFSSQVVMPMSGQAEFRQGRAQKVVDVTKFKVRRVARGVGIETTLGPSFVIGSHWSLESFH